LASAIEEFGNHKAIDGLLEIYLSHPNLQNIEALVLACTHYPVIKDNIARIYNNRLEIIDSSDAVAKAVKKTLEKENLLNQHGKSMKHFYVSDYTESFAAGAKLFFNEDISLEHYPLWD
jgi:glutamate racemase